MKKLFKLATLILVVAMLAGLLVPVATALPEGVAGPATNVDGETPANWVDLGNGDWAHNFLMRYDGQQVLAGTRGWFQQAGNWYYFLDTGLMARGTQNVDGAWRVFTDAGVLVVGDRSGWVRLDSDAWGSDWAFVNENGNRVNNDWIEFEGNWYRIADGVMLRNVLRNISGNNFYFDNNGVMQTGWTNVPGWGWMYFLQNGVMQTGWVQTGEYWYYTHPETGVLLQGRWRIGNEVHLFTSGGDNAGAWVSRLQTGLAGLPGPTQVIPWN